ncbi:MAG: CmcJ/NvfI family oxidoreductase [Myxococcota bacterium]
MAPVTAPLNFIVPQDEKPSFESALLTGGLPRFSFETEAHIVPIHDARALSPPATVDVQGFALRRHLTAVEDLYDDDALREVYYPEIEALLTAEFDADRVVVFDSTRRSDGRGGAVNRDGPRGPATKVHVDYTIDSGPKRVRDVLGETEANQLLADGVRIRQVNVWRPIRGPVERSPLAIADASSVDSTDLVATDQIFPERIGEIYHLAYAPSQRWYYAPRMTPDEVILIKGWDSEDGVQARFTPHSAFEHPETNGDAKPRESIETRTLVIG